MRRIPTLPALLAMCLAGACAPRQPVEPPRTGLPAGTGFRSEKLAEIEAAVNEAVGRGALPGAVVWLEREGAVYRGVFGQRALQPEPEAMTEDTLFDAASLTKVMATTPAVMRLVERGEVDLDAPVRRYLPEFDGDGREAITVRHLLTHTSGLRAGIGLRPEWTGYDGGIQRALGERPEWVPEMRSRYSDVNYLLLGELVRRVSGVGLDRFCAEEFYLPLGMAHTGFRPASVLRGRIAPTTKAGESFLRGEVHDPTARRMGGVAGHAGLFTTAADTARFARMLLGGGTVGTVTVLRPETVRLMTTVQTPSSLPAARRGLGWDIDSPYAGPRGDHFPVGSYGHTGWTGTSLWVDPFSRTFVILMSNRNHPTEEGNVLALRRRLGTLAAEAVGDFNFHGVPGALPRQGRETGGAATGGASGRQAGGVRNGIDVLVEGGFAVLRGLKVGLITNHTGTDRERNPTIDLLKSAPGVDLRCLFSPEHGIRGVLDEKVPDGVDERTGLPVHSLYGETRQPRAGQLEGLDALVFDIQDIGCRFYTYISTMGLSMEAAHRSGLKFFVLDRVNPIGSRVEGPVNTEGESTFVAYHPIPLRHGMTVGELARMFAEERGWAGTGMLTVIPVEGWRRDRGYDETGLPWINPSPNMRSLKQAILYPGVGLLESAVSVGRGTDTPFEVVGAPYIDDRRWARELNAAGLPGIRFVPVRFTPKASVFQGQECGGVYLMLNDRDACPVVEVGLTLALTLQRLHPGVFALDRMAHLLRHPPTLEAIRSGRSAAEIRALWAADLGEFHVRRARFQIYE
ncbi:MAG: DUF1343 domain-containing protein [Verrucomicrobiae bacterium]|nr:DUF1343 domain-containing protein [Verrucomicrobiae bacterium]